MKLCSDGHEEICFEGTDCIACELLQEVKNLEAEVTDLKIEIEKITEQE